MIPSDAEAAPLFRDLAAGRRRAVVWGAAAILPHILLQSPFPVSAVLDQNPNLWGRRILGVPILPPDDLAGMDPGTTVVLVAADIHRFGAEIERHIATLGGHPVAQWPELETLDDLIGSPISPTPTRLDDWVRPLNEAFWNGTPNVVAEALRRHAPPRRTPRDDAPHACLWVGALATGGAERQIVYLALGLRDLGFRVTLITRFPPGQAADEYVRRVDEAGVERIELPGYREFWGDMNPELLERRHPALEATAPLRTFVAFSVAATVEALESARPDLLIGFMDAGGVVAGIAGLLTGTPHILMCGRSVNPDNFPHLQPVCRSTRSLPALYRVLLEHPSVRIANNSAAGADSYARWIGIPRASIAVTPNAVDLDTLSRVPRDAGNSRRAGLGLSKDAPVIVGVARLTEEKEPFLFLEVVERVHRRLPDVRAVLVGDGPLRGELEARVEERGMGEVVTLLGNRADVFEILRMGDLLLQTSRMEGMPNVVIEAQALGLPAVVTAVGGTLECLAPELRPLSAAAGDVEALAAHCLEALTSPKRAELGRAAAAFIASTSSIPTMTRDILNAAGMSVEK